MEIYITVVVMLICLMAEAFFSGSEIGVVSADQMKLRHEAAKGSKGARLALKMLKRPEWLLSTTLVGTNIAVVTNTTMATALMMELSPEYGRVLAVVLVAPLIWVFGEIVPKSVFQQRADQITPVAIFVLRAASYLFYPILLVFTTLTSFLTKILGGASQSPFTLREEIITMIQMPVQEGDIQAVEKRMIRRIFNFSETSVQDVMVPLIEVVALDSSETVAGAMELAGTSAHVRLPVFDERVDRIVGMVYALELMGADPAAPIKTHIRPIRYVPESKSISELFLEMRSNREALAIIVDEFGGAKGIITIEDIMEEVVEDLEDEYDTRTRTPQWIKKLNENDYVVSARVELSQLNAELGLELADAKYATLGGYLLSRVNDIPSVGTVIKGNGTNFTVQRSTPQAIQEVRITW